MGSAQPTPIGRFLAALPGTLARVFAVDWRLLGPNQQTLFHVALLACLFNLCASVYDLWHFGGTDLRARVIGARALLRGRDPYTLTSSPELPPALQDPHQEHAGLSRCTYPPVLLAVYALFAELPYPLQRGLWIVLEWSALAGLFALLARLIRAHQTRFLFVVVMLGLVAASYFWRLHVERGQYYVFIALLVAGGLSLCFQKRGDHLGAGFLLGIAWALRPTAGLMLIPLWMAGMRKTAITGILTAVSLVALTIPWAGITGWRQFAWACGEWERGLIDRDYFQQTYGAIEPRSESVDGFRPESLPGLSGNLSLGLTLATVSVKVAGVDVSTGIFLSRVVFLLVVALLTAVLFLARRQHILSLRRALAASVLLMLVGDYFVPIRVSYADVLLCLPMALIFPLLLRSAYRPFWVLLLAGFLVWLIPVGAPLDIRYAVLANAFRVLVVVYVCVLYVCARPITRAWKGRLGSAPPTRRDPVPEVLNPQPTREYAR